MRARATYIGRRTVLQRAFFVSIFTFVTWGTSTWASTRVGNMELQMWYATRNTFHTNGRDQFDWVQWRNEVFFWLTYENAIKNGKAFGQYDIPLIKNATLNARYRFRADPTWTLRESYKNQYDKHERKSYLFPENGFRDLFADLDFGEVGPGTLGMRIGYQQIVWGESDLFRSIDVINPLRIDQNQGAGEKFDEFRTPIFAFKGLYNVGNVGSWFSNVFVEPFFTPGFRGPNSNLIADGLSLRAPFHVKGCLDSDNQLVDYSPSNCSFRRTDGSRVFVPWNPSWRGRAQSRHPWAFINRSPNPVGGSPDYAAGNQPDIAFDRISYVPSAYKGTGNGPLNGMWHAKTMAAGFRIFGSSIGGFDFSLNYANIPQGSSGTFNFSEIQNSPAQGGGLRKDSFYGDAADLGLAQELGADQFAGSFEEGLRRCLSEDGKRGNVRNAKGQTRPDSTVLVGVDMNGYNNPDRYVKNNPNGALNDNGEPIAGKHNAVRLPVTLCLPYNYHWTRTNIIGFTSTYNDFDYTGAIFRLEQSFSTKEYMRHTPPGSGRRGADPLDDFTYNKDYHNYTGVWRSMVGFDLLKSMAFFKYVPGIHRSFYEQTWFLSGQWLMNNPWNNRANPLCYIVDNTGNGLTKEQAAAKTAETGKKHYSNSQCRVYRFNHLFTLGFANQGLFGSRLETRNAVAFEPRAKDWLLFSQWWWRNVLGYPRVELSFGVAWYPGSSISQGWTGLYAFADRDQVWAEFKYYLL